MRTITIKGIPDDLYRRLRRRAAEHRRSINREVIVCLERSLQSRRIDPESFLARVDALRERVGLAPANEEILKAARAAGRP